MRSLAAAGVALMGAAVLLAPAPAGAQPLPLRLRVTFQPDCYRSTLASSCDPRKSGARLDLGPQIAVWIESADGRQFVDTVMVTNLTALLGIGNRPGHWSLPSGPKFPYGKRPMALPVWAHRRGRLYETVVMQDGVEKEYWLGFHETVSSPDPYYCRPMSLTEIDVDAVSCPTVRFNSAKGRFFLPELDLEGHREADGSPRSYVPPAKSYYPPRNDLRTFLERDCDRPSAGMCAATSAKRFAEENDLDMVAAATPAYGRSFTKTWRMPDELPDGDYAVLVEINKEFDENASHAHPAREDPMLRSWGLTNNFGQPSVVFRVPIRLSRGRGAEAAMADIAGYADWDGATGTLHPPDSTIGDAPGSGSGRLLVISEPSISGGPPLMGRVIVSTDAPPSGRPEPDAGPAASPDAGAPGDASVAAERASTDADQTPVVDAPARAPCYPVFAEVERLEVVPGAVGAEVAELRFVEPSAIPWLRIDEYEVRYWNGTEATPEAFAQGLPVDRMPRRAPGGPLSFAVKDLKGESLYTVGVRPVGECVHAVATYARFTTTAREFRQLSGCFIATAAYGSPLAAQVAALRAARDRVRVGSALGAVVVDAYERSSPPVAAALAGSEAARAVVRRLIAPVAELLRRPD